MSKSYLQKNTLRNYGTQYIDYEITYSDLKTLSNSWEVSIKTFRKFHNAIDTLDDIYIFVASFGKGKSSFLMAMAGEGWAIGCDTLDQVMDKKKKFCNTKKEMNYTTNGISSDFPYQVLCGREKFLGVDDLYWSKGKLNFELVDEELPGHIYSYDDTKGIHKKIVTKSDRRNTRRKIKKTMERENCSFSTAWDRNRGDYLIKNYGRAMSPKVREKVTTFATTQLLSSFAKMSTTGTGPWVVEEGGEGNETKLEWKGPKTGIVDGLLSVQPSNAFQRGFVNPGDVKSFKLESDFMKNNVGKGPFLRLVDHLTQIVDEIYDYIESTPTERIEDNVGYLDFRLKDAVTKKNWKYLKNDWRKVNRNNALSVEKRENDDIDSLSFFNKLQGLVRKLIQFDGVELLAKKELNGKPLEITGEKFTYYDIFDYSIRQPVYIPHASLNEERLHYLKNKLYPNYQNNTVVPSSSIRSPFVKTVGEKMDYNYINFSNFKTEFKVVPFQNKESWAKRNLTTKRSEILWETIDYLKDTSVVSPKHGLKRASTGNPNNWKSIEMENYFPDTEHQTFSKAEGSDMYSDKHFVISSNRRNHKHLWKEVFFEYKELVDLDSEDFDDLMKTKKGFQTGYKNPEKVFNDFQWDKNPSFNPLQNFWDREIVMNAFEKLFRKRNLDSGTVYRLGIDVVDEVTNYTPNKMDNEWHLIVELVDGMSFREQLEWLEKIDWTEQTWKSFDDKWTQKVMIGEVGFFTPKSFFELTNPKNRFRLSWKKKELFEFMVFIEASRKKPIEFGELDSRLPIDLPSEKRVKYHWTPDVDVEIVEDGEKLSFIPI